MTIEKFLSFWDHHNTSIIEGLLGLIILLALFLAFRAFFAKKGSSSTNAENGQGLDAAQLEKTLQKILDNQSSAPAAKSRAAAEDLGVDVEMDESPLTTKKAQASAASGAAASAEAAAVVAESAAEVAQLRLSLSENHQKVETLQAQLQEALAAAQAASSGGGAGGGEGGMSAAEKEELSGKLRDLEARLAEYEIISEDIADLSRYRDENEDLKKQLEALKAGAPAASAPTPAPAAPVQAEAPAAEPIPEPAAAPAAEVAAELAPEAAADSGGGSDLIDDDLMKEFAAAVEGQRALDKAAEKAGDGSEEAAKNGDETNQLMSEFENFVTKKS